MLFVRRVPLVAVLLGGVACATVRPVAQPTQFFLQASPDIVVVTYTDNSQVPVSMPQLKGDTLVGTWLGLGEPVAVPLRDVQRIDALQRSPKRTTLLIAGIAAFTVATVYTVRKVGAPGGRVCDYAMGAPGDNCVGEGWDGVGPNRN